MWNRPLLYHCASHAHVASRASCARHIVDDTLSARRACSHQSKQPRLQYPGFTLIDVMITVAIVGLLAAIAYPSYLSAVRKSNRAAAESHLSDIAQRQQQFLLDQRSYAANLSTLGVVTPGSVSPYYTIAIATADGPPPSFTASATPTGSQAGDLSGQALTITNTGAKGPSGAW
jgi:type IV pilus assembly protein PilE